MPQELQQTADEPQTSGHHKNKMEEFKDENHFDDVQFVQNSENDAELEDRFKDAEGGTDRQGSMEESFNSRKRSSVFGKGSGGRGGLHASSRMAKNLGGSDMQHRFDDLSERHGSATYDGHSQGRAGSILKSVLSQD